MSLIFRLLEEDDIPNAVDCLAHTFVEREPLGVMLAVTYDEAKEFSLLLCKKAIQEKLGMLAIDSATREIVGCMLCEDFRGDPLSLENNLQNNRKFIIDSALLNELKKPLKQWTKEKGILCRGVILTVNKKFSHHGIATQLMQNVLIYLKQKGFQYYFAEYTNPFSYQMMKHLDNNKGNDLNAIHLKDFQFEGEKIFAGSSHKIFLRINDIAEVLDLIR